MLGDLEAVGRPYGELHARLLIGFPEHHDSSGGENPHAMVDDALDLVGYLIAHRRGPRGEVPDLVPQTRFVATQVHEQHGNDDEVPDADDEPVQLEFGRSEARAHLGADRHEHDDDRRRRQEHALPSPPDGAAEQRKNEVDEKRARGTEGEILEYREHDDVRDVGDERQPAGAAASPHDPEEDDGIRHVTGVKQVRQPRETGRFGGIEPDRKQRKCGEHDPRRGDRALGSRPREPIRK